LSGQKQKRAAQGLTDRPQRIPATLKEFPHAAQMQAHENKNSAHLLMAPYCAFEYPAVKPVSSDFAENVLLILQDGGVCQGIIYTVM